MTVTVHIDIIPYRLILDLPFFIRCYKSWGTSTARSISPFLQCYHYHGKMFALQHPSAKLPILMCPVEQFQRPPKCRFFGERCLGWHPPLGGCVHLTPLRSVEVPPSLTRQNAKGQKQYPAGFNVKHPDLCLSHLGSRLEVHADCSHSFLQIDHTQSYLGLIIQFYQIYRAWLFIIQLYIVIHNITQNYTYYDLIYYVQWHVVVMRASKATWTARCHTLLSQLLWLWWVRCW